MTSLPMTRAGIGISLFGQIYFLTNRNPQLKNYLKFGNIYIFPTFNNSFRDVSVIVRRKGTWLVGQALHFCSNSILTYSSSISIDLLERGSPQNNPGAPLNLRKTGRCRFRRTSAAAPWRPASWRRSNSICPRQVELEVRGAVCSNYAWQVS